MFQNSLPTFILFWNKSVIRCEHVKRLETNGDIEKARGKDWNVAKNFTFASNGDQPSPSSPCTIKHEHCKVGIGALEISVSSNVSTWQTIFAERGSRKWDFSIGALWNYLKISRESLQSYRMYADVHVCILWGLRCERNDLACKWQRSLAGSLSTDVTVRLAIYILAKCHKSEWWDHRYMQVNQEDRVKVWRPPHISGRQ